MPYNYEKAKRIFDTVKPMLALYEKDFGKYPFEKDGFTLMESLYPMEHQGAVTFGPIDNPVLSDQTDFDDLTRTAWHESAHEWWGNSITCKDMADLWIHEAFATYAEVLAYEAFAGKTAAGKYLKDQTPGNTRPIIGTYDVNDFHLGDMYPKGCLMLNTLRNCIGNDSLWFALLRGLQHRFRYQSVTTGDIVGYINETTKKDYTPFFDQYLRHTAIPRLELMTNQRGDTLVLSYRWKTDVDHFEMPVELYSAKGMRTRLTPTGEWQTISLPRWTAADLKVDTDDYYVDVELK
jgi:aminopeptidase N